MKSNGENSNRSDKPKPGSGEPDPIQVTGTPPWGPPSGRRLATGVTAWCVIQTVLILMAPAIGGSDSVVGYGAVTLTSLLASWLLPFALLGARVRPSTVLLIAISVGLGWLLNPVELYGRPVYADEAYGYYLTLAGWGVIVAVPVFQLSMNLLRSFADRRTAEAPSGLAMDLRHRARIYRRESRWSLFVIIVAITVGAIIFTLADGIATAGVDRQLRQVQADLRAVQDQHRGVLDAVGAVRSQGELVERRLFRLDSVLAVGQEQQQAVEAAIQSLWSKGDLAEGQLVRLDSALAVGQGLRQAAQTAADSTAISQEMLQSLDQGLTGITTQLDRFVYFIGSGTDEPAQQLDALLVTIARDHQEDEALRAILSSLATRVGAVLLIVFLVQILAGLYRYSARMAAHHQSQADVLSLGDGLSQADAINLLATTQVDFGKAPVAPTAQIKEIVARTIEALKTKP